MEKLFRRQSIRLPGWDYASPGFYFVTIRVVNNDDKYIFGNVHDKQMHNNVYGKIVCDELLNTELMRENVRIHDFIVMPDHVHVIIQITKRIYDNDPDRLRPRDDPDRLRMWGNCLRPRDDPDRLRRGVLQYAPTKLTHPKLTHTKSLNYKSPSNTIGAVIRGFKSTTTKQINILRKTLGQCVWQRNYYEHIIRNEIDFERVRMYIFNNPGNWEDPL